MSKNGARGYIVLLIILLFFSIVAFVPPFSMTAAFWIAYVFAVIAIAFQIYVFKISFSGEGNAKSKFYGFPIAKVGVVYLIVQLTISLVEICLAAILPAWVVVIVNIVPIAFAIVGCVAAEAMRDEIVRQDVVLKKDVSNMRGLQSLSVSLVGQCTDTDLKVTIQKLADDFKYSDPVSSEQTKAIESELETQMKELQRAVIDNDVESSKVLCVNLTNSLAERNRVCALNK